MEKLDRSVITGKQLYSLKTKFKQRYCIDEIIKYLNSTCSDICAIYGLRRTGKTVLMRQCIEYLLSEIHCNENEIVYITLPENGNITDDDIIDFLENRVGKAKYVFIDEFSYLKTDIENNNLNLLADKYCSMGMRIIIAGTYSYMIKLLGYETLFDRIQMIDTSYFSYKEANCILGYTIESFIEYGGIIRAESERYNPNDYMKTAVISNIVTSLIKSEKLYEMATTDTNFEDLLQLDERKRNAKLSALIRQVIDRFMKTLLYDSIIKEKYRYSDIGNIADVIIQRSEREHYVENLSRVNIDKSKYYDYVLNKLGKISKNDISEKTYNSIIKILKEIKLIEDINIEDRVVSYCTSYYLRYGLCKEIISLINEEIKNDTSSRYDGKIGYEILKGNILEGIVYIDLYKSTKYRFFKYRNTDGFEIDIAIVNGEKIDIYEIKYSDERKIEHIKNMANRDFTFEILSEAKVRYNKEYELGKKYVLYNGKNSKEIYNPKTVFETLREATMIIEKNTSSKKWEKLRNRAAIQGWEEIEIEYMNISEFLRNI